MDIDSLRMLWTSPANQPNQNQQEGFLRLAHAAIERDRRNADGMTRFVLVMATLTTIFSARQLITSGFAGLDAWYAHLMLAATWVGALLLVRQYRLRARPTGASIRATLESLRDRSLRRYRECQVLLCLFISFVPLLVIAIEQLQLAGKMRPHEAASASFLAAILLATGIGWFLFDLFAIRRPELRHLELMIDDYKD